MVSGFLTSPCDHCLMSSAVARPMRRSSKKLTSSTCVIPWGSSWSSSDLFNAARLTPGQVDAEFLGGAEHILVGVTHLDRGTVAGEYLHVEAEGLHLLDQHLERFRYPGLGDVLALHDGLVDLDAAEDVVGLDGEQLLQRVRRAVRFERPHLHLAEALAPELRLSAQRLLGDHRVGTGGAGVDLVVDEVQ